MSKKLSALATVLVSLFLLSAAPGCAVGGEPDSDVAANIDGDKADKADDGATVDSIDTQSEPGSRIGATHRYNEDLPATDGVETAEADDTTYVGPQGYDVSDVLEGLRAKWVKSAP